MSRRLSAFLACTLLAVAPPARAACVLGRLAELPVEMRGSTPLVKARVNGREGLFIADSGAFYSMVTHSGAVRFGLKPHLAASESSVVGVGGTEETALAIADSFGFGGGEFHRVAFLLSAQDFGADVSGLLGQNLWRLGDVEYDLGGGAIRLFRPHDCVADAGLAYWAAGRPVSELALSVSTPEFPHTSGVVLVNGVRLRATFDTGAAFSIVSLGAAARAGVRPTDKGVTDGGEVNGIGLHAVKTWIAPFESLTLGDEQVNHPHLRIGKLETGDEVLVGADFFRSHRVYVAAGRERMFFTYGGGPVFSLERRHDPAAPAPAAR